MVAVNAGNLSVLYIIALLLIGRGKPNEFSNIASEFKVAYLRQFSSTSRIDMIILTKSVSPVQFSISSLNGSIHNGTTTRDTPAIVTLPSTLQVRETTYDYRQLGLLVTSPPDKPISVVLVGWTSTPRSTYLALPCIEQPVQEYVYYGVSSRDTSGSHSQVLLVGCRDNTTVTITPTHDVQLPDNPQSSTSSIINVAAGSSHTITLHSLQTLLIGAPNVDLSGTKIVSNYPLTVVGGHDCVQIPSGFLDCDPISTQVPPTINWGTQFLLTPLYSRTNGQRLKIIASDNATIVAITCNTSSINTALMSPGSFLEYNTNHTDFCDLTCSRPCYVSELAFSMTYQSNFDSDGDPLLMTVPPISQYPHSVTFTTLPAMPTNFYSIAVPADSYYNGTVIINGVLTTLNWTPIRDTNGVIIGYGYNTTASGSYTISHSHPNGTIYVSAYGFAPNGGYGYLTGTFLQPQFCKLVNFSSNVYYATEGGKAMIYVQRNVSDTEDTILISYNGFNETVVFALGKSIASVSVSIPDDDYSTEESVYNLTVGFTVLTSDLYCTNSDETTVVIRDDDYLTIGLSSVTMREEVREVSVGITFSNGTLKPDNIANLFLQIKNLQGQSLTNILQFNYSISSYTVSYDITKLATELSLTNDEPVNVTALLLPFDEEGPLVSISPSALTFMLFDTPYITSSMPLISPTPSLETTTSTLLFVSTVYVTVEPTTVYMPTAATTVFTTVESTNSLFSQAIGNTYTIIGASALAVLALVFTALCVVTGIISYKCGKRKQANGFRDRSSTELIANELYRNNNANSINDDVEEYAELRHEKNDPISYSKLQHTRYTEVDLTDATYASIKRETETAMQELNDVPGEGAGDSRVYTSLDPATLNEQDNYDVTISSNDADNNSIESYEELKDFIIN
ncbi:PREDICTED: uncharacterized protein LOC109587766 [Amphimedon queenslandica]|uniref:IgGFc-binding protein N-terminal domain-containing protein n=1 Tax=Amphimedon queenslandica TaxID=400682 RepID=A0A1X7VPL8_AMPQE|nr:PREDICTED: uncharacterized protein LOC109587766 [Amphimedon queenslandica]|eukprot:XP_019859551.1 PREDICTED: uncharacterized protein LOC109587766 [Amphimedon queenslandica]